LKKILAVAIANARSDVPRSTKEVLQENSSLDSALPVSTNTIVQVTRGLSSSKDDVYDTLDKLQKKTKVLSIVMVSELARAREIEAGKSLQVGTDHGPPFILLIVDQQLFAVARDLRAMHAPTFDRIVPLLGPTHEGWSDEARFLKKWGPFLLQHTMSAHGLDTMSKYNHLLSNKDHRYVLLCLVSFLLFLFCFKTDWSDSSCSLALTHWFAYLSIGFRGMSQMHPRQWANWSTRRVFLILRRIQCGATSPMWLFSIACTSSPGSSQDTTPSAQATQTCSGKHSWQLWHRLP
jgi:hypothetical protein